MNDYPEPGELYWHAPWACWVVVVPDYIARNEPYDLRAVEEVAVWKFSPDGPHGATVKLSSLKDPQSANERPPR